MEGILDAFTRPLARLDGEVGDALGDLAVRIAGTLLRRSYAVEPALLEALVREALELAGSDQRQVELRLHPDDLAMLSPQLLSLQGVRLSGDTTLARGDLRLHADSVRIDGSLSARLNATLQRIIAGAGA
jgi:flagellar assembly protein FliH